jgi:hypothetical protein
VWTLNLHNRRVEQATSKRHQAHVLLIACLSCYSTLKTENFSLKRRSVSTGVYDVMPEGETRLSYRFDGNSEIGLWLEI